MDGGVGPVRHDGFGYHRSMSNVIRPTFGARASAVSNTPPTPREGGEIYQPLRIYGTAADHLVALLRDDAAPEGPVMKVVIGRKTGNIVETVTILPATPEGEADADLAAMAVLRALEIIEGRRGSTA